MSEGPTTGQDVRILADLARRNGQIREIREITGCADTPSAIRKIRELIDLAGQVPDLRKQLDEAQAQIGTADSKGKELEQTRLELRQVRHRQAFDQAAVAAGVRPDALADLYQLSGLQAPDEGDASAESFAEYLGKAKESRAWAFGGSSPAGQTGSPRPAGQTGSTQGAAAVPPPGAGRSASGSVGQVTYTSQDVMKHGWQQRRPDLVEALKAGTAVRVGE